MKQLWKDELINVKTRCWAQGMDGWRALHLIPQLKWSLLATGQAALNETDLATLILNMLIRMCEYYPSRYDSTSVPCQCSEQGSYSNSDKLLKSVEVASKQFTAQQGACHHGHRQG